MPLKNGWECLSDLKADKELNAIPVIIYSTSAPNIAGLRSIKSGALCYLEKSDSFIKVQEL